MGGTKWVRRAWLFACAAALAACVGDARITSTDSLRDGDGPRLEATSTWTVLADEWQTFSLASITTVRYGAGTTWVERTLAAGQARCTNDFFGSDPLPGVVKRCEALASSGGTGWSVAAGEWMSFDLAQPARVRYGSGSSWVERDLPAGTSFCTNATFGTDPLPGIVKQCEVASGATSQQQGDAWMFAADEWAAFTLAQPARVRFGAGDAWSDRDLPAGTFACTTSFFGGDPAFGTVKRCEVLASADASRCDAALTLSSPPSDAVDARAAGARGDGRSDDTAAIQAALDALRPGQWLVFPPGTYVHSSSLSVQVPGVVIDGRGATLHATNPFDQAVLVQADHVRIHGFTMTAVTQGRLSAAWQSRIAVWRNGGTALAPLVGAAIVDNRIVESGGPGTPTANGASSAGIFVHNARDFIVARNTVRRTLADGIHVTGGSRGGQVVFNTVRETGDDMIAVVSYLDDVPRPVSPAAAAAALPALRERNLTRDILVADNDVAGQYWGRGISVVGGEDVGILRNAIDATTHAASVYLAREQAYGTFGVRNVRVEDNRITRVQTTAPTYMPPGAEGGWTTGHGAVEVVAMQYDGETAQAVLRNELVVRRVRVAGNRVDVGSSPGMRIGYGWGERWSEAVDGVSRGFGGATVSEVNFESNTLNAVLDGLEVFNADDPALALSCAGNTIDGAGFGHAACRAGGVTVTGSSRSTCSWAR